MRSKLPGHFHSALKMKSVLKGSTLYGAVMNLIEFYAMQVEMVCPPLNAPLLLFKHVRDLGLPGKFEVLGLRDLANRQQSRFILLSAV